MRLFSKRPARRNRAPALDLSWVDEFVTRVRPFVFVRLEDRILIKRPNEAQKLNEPGARVLKELLDGKSIARLLDELGRHPRVVRDVHEFLREVERFLEGRLDELAPGPALEVRPFELGFSQLPVLSEVALTYRCNLRCSFCYAGCNCTANPVGDEREMTTTEVREVLRRIRHQAQVPSVSFTGGEATLRPDLPELVARASELGLRVNLITNGTRVTETLAAELAAAGLASAQVSLEGVTAAVHERVTRVKGSFVGAVAAVRRLRATGVRTHTNTTLCRPNLHESAALPRFVAEELGGERFSMNLIVSAGSAARDERLVVRYAELGPHLERVRRASERHGVELMWYSPTPMCLFNPIAHGLGNKGCSACDGLLSVAANGDVLPCSSFDESVGNLLRQDVRAVWGSERATFHRDKRLAHPQCRACEDFAACQGACPLYWRSLGFGELHERKGFAPVDEEHFER